MGEIKIYERLTMIKLKDGRILQTTLNKEQVSEILNSQEFIVIDGTGFNKFEVKIFDEYSPSDVDCYVLSLEKELREKVEHEIAIRKEKRLRISMGIVNNIIEKVSK